MFLSTSPGFICASKRALDGGFWGYKGIMDKKMELLYHIWVCVYIYIHIAVTEGNIQG